MDARTWLLLCPLLIVSIMGYVGCLVAFVFSLSISYINVASTHIRLYKMLSFRLGFILLAAASFATVASEIPTVPPASNDMLVLGADSIINIIDSLGNVIGDIRYDLPR